MAKLIEKFKTFKFLSNENLKELEEPKPRIEEPKSDVSQTTPEEKEAYLWLLLELALKDSEFNTYAYWESFISTWSHAGYYGMEYKLKLLQGRGVWFSIKKEGKVFQDFLRAKIESGGDFVELYKLIAIYGDLGYEDTVSVFSRLLDRSEIWNYVDGSVVHTIMEFIRAKGDLDSVGAISGYINNILSPEYVRKQHLSSDLSYAVDALRGIAGDGAWDILNSIAEGSKTFSGWFEIFQLSVSKGHFGQKSFDVVTKYMKDKFTLDEFDEEKEKARLAELQVQYDAWSKSYLYKSPEHEAPYESLEDDKTEFSSEESDWESRDQPEKESESLRRINFHGRFVPRLERAIAIDSDNHLSATLATLKKNSREDYLRFLSGFVEKDILDGEPFKDSQELSPEFIGRAIVLRCAYALCMGVLEGRFEEAKEEAVEIMTWIRELEVNGYDRDQKAEFTAPPHPSGRTNKNKTGRFFKG